MATLNSMTIHELLLSPFTIKPFSESSKSSFSIKPITTSFKLNPLLKNSTTGRRRRSWVVRSVTEDKELVPVKNKQSREQEKAISVNGSVEKGGDDVESDDDKPISRAVNAAIVLGAGTVAVTRLLTIDHDYWQGWTLYEILRYAPEHNWIAYEEALKTNPVLAKMAISGIVYSIGDWIAQCYEGKPLFDFDSKRMFRSGLVGFTLHGSLIITTNSVRLFFLSKIAFLRFESPANTFSELKATFWPMLTAGWKLWPFAHLVTYGVVPLEQRLLWVDCVELIWVTILSTYSNEKSEERISEANSNSSSSSHEE
ncbi:hypothetical protein LWI29_034139 [Acer saccharum]|uniref:Uncharacterized protein n=1 Tax=Acer saccharum TaxID=4024 RepID=A0AA39SIR9_ACESA|nr:hypothetical protein LWI29_034139 [Acer saccharum]